jgi:hypothetical protein
MQPAKKNNLSLRQTVALGQGVYFALTGIWAIVHIKSFMAVTGPKTDTWLVKTVGALVGVLGGVLAARAASKEPSDDLETVAVGSAAALAAVDVVYVARKRIAPIYLLDAVAEAVLIAGWAFARGSKEVRKP